MSAAAGPLLTRTVHDLLLAARGPAQTLIECTLDLGRSTSRVTAGAEHWSWEGRSFPYAEVCRERTVYYWNGATFEPVARYGAALVKLVPTEWGAPTFEIDGVKMLPTARVSPYEDAGRKVALIQPRGKTILDTCGGLGYFAAWCLQGGAARVCSFERDADVLWLRRLNPWSPDYGGAVNTQLELQHADVVEQIARLPATSCDAILHDPPRFALAGELYSQAFYDQLARVLRHRGRLFHYTGAPNSRSRGRNLAAEVTRRLRAAGFGTEPAGDGVLAILV